MSFVLLVLQIALAGMFVAAAAAKALRSEEFVAALRLSHLPESSISVLAIAVPALEVVIALWLVLSTGVSTAYAFVAALLLLAIFTGWMIWVNTRRLHVRCGCFGPDGGDVGRGTIARNSMLMVAALAGFLVSLTVRSPLPGLSLESVIAASALAMSIALVQALRLAWPHMVMTFNQYQETGLGELE